MSLRSVGILPVCAAAGALVVAKVWLRLAAGPAVQWAMRGDDALASELQSSHHNVARAVAGAGARWPLRATCLEQSIALVLLLKRAGVPARVTIGVTRSGAALHGHAYVQSSGHVLLGGAQMEGLLPLTGLSCRG